LGQPHPTEYRLAGGDELGIWIEGVLGERAAPPPMQIIPPIQGREQRRQPTPAGYPFRVRRNGTLRLPMIDPCPLPA
jgi:hypothetical protein